MINEDIDYFEKAIDYLKYFFKNFSCKCGRHNYVRKSIRNCTKLYDDWCRKNDERRIPHIHEYDWQTVELKICIKCGHIDDSIQYYINQLDKKLVELRKADDIYKKYKERSKNE